MCSMARPLLLPCLQRLFNVRTLENSTSFLSVLVPWGPTSVGMSRLVLLISNSTTRAPSLKASAASVWGASLPEVPTYYWFSSAAMLRLAPILLPSTATVSYLDIRSSSSDDAFGINISSFPNVKCLLFFYLEGKRVIFVNVFRKTI